MLFKTELITKILASQKRQTRRPVRGVNLLVDSWGNPAATDVPHFLFGLQGDIQVVTTEKGRAIYEVGKTYAICPGRGKPQVARFKLIKIRYEDVRYISLLDALDEGFAGRLEFWQTWLNFYDPKVLKMSVVLFANGDITTEAIENMLFHHMSERPDELYTAWALTFKLVN